MFLEVSPYQNYSSNFTDTDTDKLLQENLKKSIIDQRYRNLEINYNFNSYGYREAEFRDIDWNNSIVVFGCSSVAGEGLPVEETITSILKNLIDIPVVNLGAIGTSIYFSAYNNLLLKNNLYKPLAVVNLWTSLYRYTNFVDLKTQEHYGIWNVNECNFYKESLKHIENLKIHQTFLHNFTKTIWQDVPYIEASTWKETAECFNIDSLEVLDYGRDNLHNGPETNYAIATYIKNKFNKLYNRRD